LATPFVLYETLEADVYILRLVDVNWTAVEKRILIFLLVSLKSKMMRLADWQIV
jgi:hypothetical protein